MISFLLPLFLAMAPPKAPPTPHPAPVIKIYFIYGSRPAKGYGSAERKWFGGIHGGHVGMEIGPDSILSFRSTEYPCHFFPHRHFSSIWEIKTVHGMWQTFPPHNYKVNELKRVVFTIPVTEEQKHRIDSIARQYLRHSPYDYATAGMRCASATYDILARAGLFKRYGGFTWCKIIMPRSLRTVLFEKARSPEGQDWKIERYEGSKKRIWEEDL